MKQIPLPNGRFAIVDDEDYEWLSKYHWTNSKSKHNYAFRTYTTKYKMVTKAMHREIVKAKENEYVDHINGNPLDNRKENLRIVTHQQNMWNRKIPSNNKTGYKGVYRCSKSNKYAASIRIDGKGKYLGLYDTAEKAAEMYNSYALEYYGEYAKLNVIGKENENAPQIPSID